MATRNPALRAHIHQLFHVYTLAMVTTVLLGYRLDRGDLFQLFGYLLFLDLAELAYNCWRAYRLGHRLSDF